MSLFRNLGKFINSLKNFPHIRDNILILQYHDRFSVMICLPLNLVTKYGNSLCDDSSDCIILHLLESRDFYYKTIFTSM